MIETKRLFIAVDVPPVWRDGLARVQKNLRKDYPKLRATPLRNLHITLCFIGDLETTKIAGLQAELTEKFKNLKKFTCKESRLGIFHNNRRTIFWYGVYAKELHEIAHLLIGYSSDDNHQNYRGHITLGRLNGTKIKDRHQQIKVEFKDFVVNKLILYESTLAPDGPIYKILAEWPLLK
jgi:2'-5' RNA ligase